MPIEEKTMAVSNWNLVIPEQMDRMVRTHLAQCVGESGDLSKFVEKAVRKEMLRETIKTVQERNADLDRQELLDTVDEAVDWARAGRS